MVVSIDSQSENPCFPVPFVDTHSFVPTALTPHPANTGVSEKWCWCVSYLICRQFQVIAYSSTLIVCHSHMLGDNGVSNL